MVRELWGSGLHNHQGSAGNSQGLLLGQWCRASPFSQRMLWCPSWNFGPAPATGRAVPGMLCAFLWQGRDSNWCKTGFFWASWLLSWFSPFPAAAGFGITKSMCVCVQYNFSTLIFGAIASQLLKKIIHCFITILGFYIYPSKQTASW